MPKSKDEKNRYKVKSKNFLKKKKKKVKSKKGKKKKKKKRQNNSCYRCYRNCRKHLELNLIYRSWKYFMCLDIPPPANDILRITRTFFISGIYIIF